ncbi:hypothetical protein ILUMI_00649, partial [Ignelater luminosus]
YYRVNYDRENWERIIDFVTTDKFKSIHVLNRAQLLEDAFYFAYIHELSWDIPLKLGEYLKQERDYIALAAFSSVLENYLLSHGEWYYQGQKAKDSVVFQNHTLINTVDSNASAFNLQKAYVKSVLGDVLAPLGTPTKESDTHLDKLTRSSVILCSIVSCQVYRLPKNVKPLRYSLTMESHLRDTDLQRTLHYDGNVKMELEVLADTKSITLHQLQLRIDNTTIELVNSNGKENIVVDTSKDGRNRTYTIRFEELVEIGIYNLTIEIEVLEVWLLLILSQQAFPCFDEPALKAKFIVSLVRREEYISISNEDLDMNLGDGRFKDTFKETPTFFLAFAVCDMKLQKKLKGKGFMQTQRP